MDFKELLEGYRKGTLNHEQRNAFERLLHSDDAKQELHEQLDASLQAVSPIEADATQAYVYTQIDTTGRSVISLRRWWWAAASILVLLAVGFLYWTQITHQPGTTRVADIQPGGNGAVLTLADGSKVVLDSLGNGVVATQNGVKVVMQNGQLSYSGEGSGPLAYNTMSTPKGRMFQLILPDGSKAWLNAASTLRYPVRFSGKERVVEVSGEVYFEIARNSVQPFRVEINNKITVEVLGTSFNINAYENERSSYATLLEGSVRVLHGKASKILKPGQQMQITTAGLKVIHNVDADKVMAWKNGLFNFEGAAFEDVMRQLERWYNIEVVYETKPPAIRFVGEMDKNLSLNDLLEILKKSNVHFRVEEGRKLVVAP